jgi:transposase InsO family protein
MTLLAVPRPRMCADPARYTTRTVGLHATASAHRRRRLRQRVTESVFGLFKNEVVAAGSPFRAGPLRTLADVEEITMDYVDWYNNDRLHSLLANITPEEFEHAYYAHQIGSPTGDAANEKTA